MELENFKIPHLYTTLCAFFCVRTFDEKDYIEIDKLVKYRKWLLEKVEQLIEDDYRRRTKEDNESFYYYSDDITYYDKVSFDKTDDYDEVNKLTQSYPEFFSIKNGKLYISDTLTPDVLEIVFQLGRIEIPDLERIEIFEDFDFVHSNIKSEFFCAIADNYAWVKQLEITKFGKLYNNFSDLEKEIEESYSIDSNEIPLKLLIRLAFVKSFYENHRPMLKYYDQIVHKEEWEILSIDSDYDEYKNSRYIKNDEKYPIDYNFYKRSKFYEDMSAFRNIQELLEDNYQYAIFGNGSLFVDKAEEYLEQIHMSIGFLMPNQLKTKDYDNIDFEELGYESYEESEDDIKKYRISLDVIEEEFAFYMIYLHKLNNAIESGHNELIWPRQRLLYMLDDIQFNLTNPNNFDKWYEWACCYDADKDTYESLGWEAGYFIQDVFEGEDYKSQEKLIFASTYYQLTKDPELKEVLEQYSDDDRYSEYSSIILGDTKGFTKRKK